MNATTLFKKQMEYVDLYIIHMIKNMFTNIKKIKYLKLSLKIIIIIIVCNYK